VFLVN